jgi:K+-transporting ATPase A subunit
MITFTRVHVVISLIAIFAGFVVTFGLLTRRRFKRWTALFLFMTLLTSVTGFLFPFHGFTPAIGVEIVSVVVLAVAYFARYGGKLERAWRWIYVVSAMLALYLNVFVLIVQAFQKIPALKSLAPTQTEPLSRSPNSAHS